MNRAGPLLLGLAVVLACVDERQDLESQSDPNPSTPEAANEAPVREPGTLRILAYNIRHGEGMDSVINLKRVAELISELEPDIVTLQEIDSAVERTFAVNQVAVLGELTGMHALFGGFFDYQGGRYGMGLLSRYPILAYENHRLPDGLEPRTALAARIDVDGTELVVVGIHLYATHEERMAQARRVIDLLQDEAAPVILAGDCNSTPDSEVMALFAGPWQIPDKGDDNFTFPSDTPDREIDYIIYRPADRFVIIDHWPVDEPLVSDHRPLILDLQLR
jgi:endonuclease/exonuclease/phosphatase family metal-dependent hydrolase